MLADAFVVPKKNQDTTNLTGAPLDYSDWHSIQGLVDGGYGAGLSATELVRESTPYYTIAGASGPTARGEVAASRRLGVLWRMPVYMTAHERACGAQDA